MKKGLTPNLNWKIPLHKVLTREEVARILTANFLAKEEALKVGDRLPVIEWMILNTSYWGLRISESACLECGRVHVEGNIAHIALKHTKGNKPRDVFIGASFATYIQEYMEWKKSVGEPTDDKAPFFFSPVISNGTGSFYSSEGLRKAFKRAVKRGLGDRNITPHSGRHTLGTHMAPVDLKLVQKILGHSNLAITEVYVHTLNPHMEEFVKTYENILYSAIKEIRKK